MSESGLDDTVIGFKQACDSNTGTFNPGGCEMTITGGTEGGHETHGPDAQVVDLRVDDGNNYTVNNFLQEDGSCTTNGNGQQVCSNGGLSCTLEGANDGASTGEHWHCEG